jgi:hypothetical protein
MRQASIMKMAAKNWNKGKMKGGSVGGWGIIKDIQEAGKMLGGWPSPK